MGHYGMEPRRIQARKANENGDVEQSHHRFKRALDQLLMLRGSRDFNSRTEYESFLKALFEQLNSGRHKRLTARVRSSSTIHIKHNVYSVHSRLIGEEVDVRLHPEHLEVWYAQRCVEKVPRIRGNREKHRIQYRHIIDWLQRKPGAFAAYRYRNDLFPTTHFRIAYDTLKKQDPLRADRHYLEILALAAKTSEADVEAALRLLIESDKQVSVAAVRELASTDIPLIPEIRIGDVDLREYDQLLPSQEVA
jgi:hypothetical protein